jgi:Tfp pilus assembly protein PilF
LLTADLSSLEPNTGAMARTLALPYAGLGIGYLERGDTTAALPLLEQAVHLAPGQSPLREFVRQLRSGVSVP